MGTRACITYRGFWDVPRIFLVSHRGQLFLFDSPFLDDWDDYSPSYFVYLMPPLNDTDLGGSWENLAKKAIGWGGCVPVTSIDFDPTRTEDIDTRILDEILDKPDEPKKQSPA